MMIAHASTLRENQHFLLCMTHMLGKIDLDQLGSPLAFDLLPITLLTPSTEWVCDQLVGAYTFTCADSLR